MFPPHDFSHFHSIFDLLQKNRNTDLFEQRVSLKREKSKNPSDHGDRIFIRKGVHAGSEERFYQILSQRKISAKGIEAEKA